MGSNNVLDTLWLSYQTTIECLKVASRGVREGEFHLINRTRLLGSTVDEVKELISESRSNADDYVIVSLWAVFERKLLECLQKEGGKLLGKNPSEFSKEVHKKLENEIEYWKLDDILGLFKTVIDSDLIGKAKQIKKYRDWVAHKNPKKGSPPNIPPMTAYKILSTIILQLEQHPDLKEDKQDKIMV